MLISEIDIGKDFSEIPRGRYHPEDGLNTGQRFREEFLIRIFEEPEKYSRPVKIVLDSVEGYGSSFLEEAFGGLVREGYVTAEEADKTFIFVYENEDFEFFERRIRDYIKTAVPVEKV